MQNADGLLDFGAGVILDLKEDGEVDVGAQG